VKPQRKVFSGKRGILVNPKWEPWGPWNSEKKKWGKVKWLPQPNNPSQIKESGDFPRRMGPSNPRSPPERGTPNPWTNLD